MLELATLGAGVLHNRSVELAKKFGVQLVVRSSLNFSEGTIVKEDTGMEKMLVSGVAATASATIKSPTIKLVGDIDHEGNMIQSGTLTNTAGISSAGDMKSSGDVSAGGISMLKHVHREQGDGQDTSIAH
jgi:aspartokinase